MLETSEDSKETVRALQRKLYRKAKQQPTFRFYSLYDKVYRSDVLQRAYDLVKQNRSGPGIDGETWEAIEQGIGKAAYLQEIQESLQRKRYRTAPIKRVEIPKANGNTRALGIPTLRDRIVQMAVKLVIEPVFEAGFSPHSYGFRPGRSAHQALDEIKEALFKGHIQVIDADISNYFDNIAHGKLMRSVAERIADKSILGILNHWLKAIVIEEGAGRRTVKAEGKRKRRGTPQGGVVSPLLANIYLNILDRIWERNKLADKHKARYIRYADDIVILCAGGTDAPYATLQAVLMKLDLKLHEHKTQIRDVRKEKFNFLGFQISLAKGRQSGKYFPLFEPAVEAMTSIKEKIKYYTRREMNPVPIEEVVNKLNVTVQGWSRYFYYGHGHRKIKQVKYYMEESLRRHLRYRHKLRNGGAAYIVFPRKYLYEHLQLYKPPVTALWKVAHA